MNEVDVVLQRVDVVCVINWHEQHNVIGIQVEFGVRRERDLGNGVHEDNEEQWPYRMEPRGTPEVTGVGGEDEPSRTTLRSLPDR